MNGWRGGSGAYTGLDVAGCPRNGGRLLGPSGMGSATALPAGPSASSRARTTAFLMARDHLVDQAVLHRFVGLEEAVALHVAVHVLDRLTRVLRVDLVDARARLEDLPGVDLDVRRLALEARRGLVHEDARVGQREALALGAAGQQQRAHAHR